VSRAENVVAGWLKADARPLGTALGQEVGNVETFTDETGMPIYYIVYLRPSGFVIVAADDLVEPIIGFVNGQSYDPSPADPLGALVTNDLNARIAAVRDIPKLQATGAMSKALESQGKWDRLEGLADQLLSDSNGLTDINDVRVAPLVQTKWGQKLSLVGNACYNYYTPLSDPCDPCDYLVDPCSSPYPYGDPCNYPCGCVATAMAQLMRFHEYPNEPNGVGKTPWHWITVDGNSEMAWMRGGNALGGPYDWDSMVLEPDYTTTKTQLQAIGALCYDAGVSVFMDYSPTGSGAWLINAAIALRDADIFSYSNAVCGANTVTMGDIGEGLNGMVNPNLDYNHPVILDITGTSVAEEGYAHAVVADGYGYELSTLYHHLNMGKQGIDDLWYNLPNVGSYSMVRGCIYNIFTSGSGEIISGRVTDTLGAPISGAEVKAYGSGGPYNTTTNDRGIYAFAHLQSVSRYTISVTKEGYTFTPKIVDTLTSSDLSATSGNVWAVDFTPSTPTVVYVDVNVPVGGNGSSWASAYKYLQDALADPNAWEIWVADGNYYPDRGAGQTPGDRYASFELRYCVALYGGYAGFGAPDPNARDVKLYETILSGDIGTPGVNTNNSYNVVTSDGTDETTILDGFTITAGNANTLSVWPTSNGGGMLNVNSNCMVNKCTFIDNYAELGGAMYNHYSHAHISNCIFFRNSSKYNGGGIMNDGASCPILVNCSFISNQTSIDGGGLGNFVYSSPTVVNCSFSNNYANWGGALANIEGSCPTITNCTFSSNRAGTCDGGIHNYNNSFPTINNCILWDNTSPQIGDSGGSAATVSYSDVQGGWMGAGVGNIDADPCFIGEPTPLGLTAGMISYWKFDEGSGTIANDSVNGNNGTISSATWTTGKVGLALYFSSGDVNVPHSSNLDIIYPFTVEAWIKATGASNYHMIVDKLLGGATSYGFSFYLSSGSLKLTLYSGANGNGSVAGTTDLRDDTWHHVVGFWDGSHMKIYIDGGFEAESPWAYPPGSTTNDLGIGQRLSCYGGCLYFTGSIDEVAIYNRVLNITEIEQHYRNGLAGLGYVDMLEDYHLQHNSPCIDVGDNNSVPLGITTDFDSRPRFVDGDCNDTVIVDMGAYEFAWTYIGDFDSDCNVDLVDFAILASYWLQDETLIDIVPPPAGDGIVDEWDLAILCDNWLAGTE
jgi:hypothetical protein